MCGHTQRLRAGKTPKVAGNLLHVYSYQGGGQISYTPNVEGKVGGITHKTLPFCSENCGPILITS